MRLYRPKVGVGLKTWFALSIFFWVPTIVLIVILFHLFRGVIYNEATNSIKTNLTAAKGVFNERTKITEGALLQTSDRKDVQQLFLEKDNSGLQALLLELGKNYSYMDILIAVDENQKVIGRKNNKTGDVIRIGDILLKSLMSGETLNSTELVSKELLIKEDEGLAKRVKETGITQFVVSPIRHDEKIIGAIISGFLLTGDSWLGNTVYDNFSVELAVFAGEPLASSILHATTSKPRSAWVVGEAIPVGLKEELSLGKPYYKTLDTPGAKNLVAFEPILDSRSRIIGAFGVSIPAEDINMLVLKTLGKGVGIAAFVGLLIAIGGTLLIYMDITRPLGFLVKAMNKFGSGETDIVVDLKTGDEFEKLGDGFNIMANRVRKREARLKKHNEVAKLLMSTLNLKKLLSKMLKIAVEITDSQIGIVYLCEKDEEEDLLMPHAQYGTKAELNILKMNEGFPGRAATDKKVFITSPPQDITDEKMELGFARVAPKELAYIPIIYQERILGVLVLGSIDKYSEEEIQLFDYLANQISIALDNAIMHEKIQELSITDPLTGLYNRRYLNIRLEEEWSRSLRHKQPISILLCDIDNFKSINDTYGHDKGDEVLKIIAQTIKDNTRKEDLVARYGGEEFVIILLDTNDGGASNFAERVLDKVRTNVIEGMDDPTTLSIGVATSTKVEATNYEELIKFADQAMYKGKIAGKNRVVASA